MNRNIAIQKGAPYRKLRLVACMQIILQGVTPLMLTLAPVAAVNAENKNSAVISQALAHKKAVEQAQYIASHYFKTGHVIAEGETLASIAQDNRLSELTLREINRIKYPSDRDYSRLGAGDVIMLPVEPQRFTTARAMEQKNSAARMQEARPASSDGADSDAGREKRMAEWLSAAGTIADSERQADATKNMAIGGASQAAADNLENWLNQFGHARVQLNVDQKFHLDGSSADLLLPLTNSPDLLTFTQLGVHDKDDYTTANLGIGQRWFSAQQMLGYNLFVDRELRNAHTRLGVGAEYWRNFLKLAGNGYIGLTGWKTSKNLDDYEEKAASGFDLRAEGYLPALPQLGARLQYEQYVGENVGLFGRDHLQKDPYAITAGVNYTPVPLVTAGVDYRQGKSSVNDTQLSLQFNYLFGVPWQAQISTDAVRELRTLAGSRLAFVDRNSNMVMQYQKMEVITLALPAHLKGKVQTQQTVLATVKAKHGLDHIQWNAAKLLAAGGKIEALSPAQYKITLPKTAGSYPLSAIAWDRRGNISNTAQSELTVSDDKPVPDFVIGGITPDKLQADADGTSPVTYTVTVKHKDAQNASSFAGYRIQWKNDGVGTLSAQQTTLDANGNAQVTVTSTLPGTVNLTATLVDTSGVKADQKPNNQVQFVSNAPVVINTLTPNKTQEIANGTSPVTWTLSVKEKTGALHSTSSFTGYTVVWANGGVGTLSAGKTTINANGEAQVSVTSKTPGFVKLKATLLDADGKQTDQKLDSQVQFIPEIVIAAPTLTLDRTKQWSDSDITVNASVKNSIGAAVKDQGLTFTLTGCTDCSLDNAAPVTDKDGKASVKLTMGIASRAGAPSLKVCLKDDPTLCSSTSTANFYAVPKITGYTVKGTGATTSSDTFNEVRLKGGEFQINATGGDGNWAWSSNSASAAKVDSQGMVTLFSSDGTDIIATAFYGDTQMERAVTFTISNTGGQFYEYPDTNNLIASASSSCPAGSRFISDSNIPKLLWQQWGDISQYRAFAGYAPKLSTWVPGSSSGSTAKVFYLAGAEGGTDKEVSNISKSRSLCEH